MKRLLLFILLCVVYTHAFADAKQERRLSISVSIFPRIVAVDEGLESKLDENNNIHLAVIYYDDSSKAIDIASKMTQKISNIAGKNIVVESIKYSELLKNNAPRITGAFLVEPVNADIRNQLVRYFTRQGILLFSPFEGDVENGVMASIFIGSKIRPYFNISSIEKAGIKLKSAIIGVSKLYE